MDPPQPLPWYPHKLAWHFSFSRAQLRKLPALEALHEFIKRENEVRVFGGRGQGIRHHFSSIIVLFLGMWCRGARGLVEERLYLKGSQSKVETSPGTGAAL